MVMLLYGTTDGTLLLFVSWPAPAGNTRSSPTKGSRPPQFAGSVQSPLAAPPVQRLVFCARAAAGVSAAAKSVSSAPRRISQRRRGRSGLRGDAAGAPAGSASCKEPAALQGRCSSAHARILTKIV